MVLSEFSGKSSEMSALHKKNGPPFPKGGPFLTLSRRSEYQCLSYYARPSAKALFIWFDLSPAGKISSLLWKSPSFFLLALASQLLQVLGLRACFRQLDAEQDA